MQMIDINLLKEHPDNSKYFDDIDGQRWLDFLDSIRTSGIIVPLVVTKDYVLETDTVEKLIKELTEKDYIVVSGNQRLRAARELGLKEVPCEIREYTDKDGITANDWILKDLIETNLRQRGKGNLNDMKLARCVFQLMRIYGIRRGGYRGDLQNLGYQNDIMSLSQPNNFQSYLAELTGISERQLQRLNKLNDLIPELQQLVDEGRLSSTAGTQLAYLDEEVQQQLYYALGDDINKMTAAQIKQIREEAEQNMKELANKINELERVNRAKELEISNKESEISQKESLIEQYKTVIELTQKRLKDLENKTVERIEVIPDSVKQEIESLKKQQADVQEQLKKAQEELERTKQEYEKIKKENLQLKFKNNETKKLEKITDALNKTHEMLKSLNDLSACEKEAVNAFLISAASLQETIENILSKIAEKTPTSVGRR